MTIQATEKLTIGVLDAHKLEDEAIRRLGFSADAIVTFSRGKAPDQADRFAELLPGVPVTDGGAVDDIRGAMIACGRRGVLVIVTPQPDNPAKFVARAIQGAATVAEEGGDVIAVQTIRRSVPVDKIAWLTETGEVSGYGVLYAAGFAKKLNAEVVLITPSGATRTPRTPAAVELARKASEEHSIAYSVISDPSPIDRVLRNPDGIGVVVHPILDAPGGRSLLHWGELPASSVASGAPEAVVRLLEGFEGNVVMVFDGTQLLAGAVPVGRRVGAAGAGLLIALGIGIGAATPAMAAEEAPGHSAPAAPTYVDGVTVTTEGHNGQAHTGTFTVVNRLDEPVTMELIATWEHSSGNRTSTLTSPTSAGTVTIPSGNTVEHHFDANRPTEGTGLGGYHLGDGVTVRITDSHGGTLAEFTGTWDSLPTQLPTKPQNQVPPDRVVEELRPAPEGMPGGDETPGDQLLTPPEAPPTPVAPAKQTATGHMVTGTFSGFSGESAFPATPPQATPEPEAPAVPEPVQVVAPAKQTATGHMVTGTFSGFSGESAFPATPPQATPEPEAPAVPEPVQVVAPAKQTATGHMVTGTFSGFSGESAFPATPPQATPEPEAPAVPEPVEVVAPAKQTATGETPATDVPVPSTPLTPAIDQSVPATQTTPAASDADEVPDSTEARTGRRTQGRHAPRAARRGTSSHRPRIRQMSSRTPVAQLAWHFWAQASWPVALG